MRELTLIAAVFCAIFSSAMSETAEGKLDCTVTGIQLMESIDGRTKEYSGYEGQFETGDTLHLKYGQDERRSYVEISNPLRNKAPYLATIFARNADVFNAYSSDGGVRVYSTRNTPHSKDFWLSPDFIRVRGGGSSGGDLGLARYSQSSWHGIVSYFKRPSASGPDSVAYAYALNCRTNANKINQVMSLWLSRFDSD